MSRVGKLPITIPSGVTMTVENKTVTVTGPKGSLSQPVLLGISLEQQENQWLVKRVNDEPVRRGNHGLMRSLINNMIVGVTEGFSKKLEIHGVGFRASLEGDKLKLTVGYSHPIIYQIPQGINVTIEQNVITVSGISKQQVGQVAAEIRNIKKPEPYKGKGIKYESERIIRKSGKSGKEKAA